MNDSIPKHGRSRKGANIPELNPEALASLPIFPLPGTVLLPGTFMSLHIFEPRYRRMLEDCADGHRIMAIAMLDEGGAPDALGRPPLHPVAGLGLLRRSAKLPDGRYNIVLEGAVRVSVANELPPDLPYRRARAQVLADQLPEDGRETEASVAAVRALCARVVAQMGPQDVEIIQRLNEVEDPSVLADLIAAAAVKDPPERQKILAEVNVGRRLNLAGASLASLLLKSPEAQTGKASFGWGIGPGRA